MKAKIEKRLIRAKKEISLINQQLRKIDVQMKDLQNSAQTLVNSKLNKQGAVIELEDILASIHIQEKEKPIAQPGTGTVKDQIGKNKGRV